MVKIEVSKLKSQSKETTKSFLVNICDFMIIRDSNAKESVESSQTVSKQVVLHDQRATANEIARMIRINSLTKTLERQRVKPTNPLQIPKDRNEP